MAAVTDGAVVVVGGTSGIGLRLAETLAAQGRDVVITGRDLGRCAEIAGRLNGNARVLPLALDLAEPEQIAPAFEHVGDVGHLVLAAIERDHNTVREYDLARATRLVTLKLIGYTEVVHALAQLPEFEVTGRRSLCSHPGPVSVGRDQVVSAVGVEHLQLRGVVPEPGRLAALDVRGGVEPRRDVYPAAL